MEPEQSKLLTGRGILRALTAVSLFLFVFFDVLFQAPRAPDPASGAVVELETIGGVSYVSEFGWYLHYVLLGVAAICLIGSILWSGIPGTRDRLT